MDDKRFDDLVKRLCTTRLTRVSMIRGLAAGTVAALTGARLASQSGDSTVLAAAGTCRNLGHPCQGNQDCCAGIEVCKVTGPGNAKRCSDVPDCGGLGELCCDGQCDLGLECDNSNHCVEPDTDCGGIGEPCCDPGNTCNEGVCDLTQGPDGTCVACGTLGLPCCDNDTCNTSDLTCSTGGPSNGTCVACGEIGLPCCEGEFCESDAVCDPTEGPDGTCVACGALGQPCCEPPDAPCDAGGTCNGTICVATPPGPTPAQTCPAVPCPAGQVCSNGQCFNFGVSCKSGETALKCCERSVKKGCGRKQSSAHARKNCLRKGKRRCTSLLGGV
jgi:hypothetical protein